MPGGVRQIRHSFQDVRITNFEMETSAGPPARPPGAVVQRAAGQPPEGRAGRGCEGGRIEPDPDGAGGVVGSDLQSWRVCKNKRHHSKTGIGRTKDRKSPAFESMFTQPLSLPGTP